ncbi:MAG: hypothetical protein MUP17_09965 [candidate division Zixibacteria bacterium]|nr:hypothetical protein [candidate division Zixibacteria bacterium]
MAEGEKKTETFDYEFLHKCQYDIDYDGRNLDCGEPAVAKGWWVDEKGTMTSVVYLCPDHLRFILAREGNNG